MSLVIHLISPRLILKRLQLVKLDNLVQSGLLASLMKPVHLHLLPPNILLLHSPEKVLLLLEVLALVAVLSHSLLVLENLLPLLVVKPFPVVRKDSVLAEMALAGLGVLCVEVVVEAVVDVALAGVVAD